MQRCAIDWGDVPTWITAVATCLALAAAVVAVIASYRLLGLERKREERAELAEAERRSREERAEQADLVAVWPSESGPGAIIENGSRLPIYRVTVTYVLPSGESHDTETVELLPPGRADAPTPWLPDVVRDPYSGEPVHIGRDTTGARHEIRFVDAAGRHWHRNINGVLTMTGRDEPAVVDVTRADFGVAQ